MKERPILFSGDMVRAVLGGPKSVTRRVVKPQPPEDCDTPLFDGSGYGFFYDGLDEDGNCFDQWPDGDSGIACPYGRPGDRLWVRETMYVDRGRETLCYAVDGTAVPRGCFAWEAWMHSYGLAPRKVPSIHMPRWASRLTLEVTDVRVERVRDISVADCRAEGVDGGEGTTELGWRYSFGSLWNSINQSRGYGWNENPWVWCLSFRRLP
jgi:hypothetical protein